MIPTKDHTFTFDKFKANAPNGPSKQELALFLFEKLKKDNPNALEPDIAKALRAENHVPLYTVTNMPDFNPIEMANAHLKKRYSGSNLMRRLDL